MLEGEAVGVQCVARLRAGRAVQVIVDERMPDVGEVDAYLMRAAGIKTHAQQRIAAVIAKHLVGCFGVLAALIVYAALDNAAFLARNGSFDNALRLLQPSLRQRQIFLVDLLLAQPELHNRLLSKNHQAGGVAVETRDRVYVGSDAAALVVVLNVIIERAADAYA